MVGAEQDRVAGFGRLEDGLRQVKARREPVKELLVLAGPGDFTPHRLAGTPQLSYCPTS